VRSRYVRAPVKLVASRPCVATWMHESGIDVVTGFTSLDSSGACSGPHHILLKHTVNQKEYKREFIPFDVAQPRREMNDTQMPDSAPGGFGRREGFGGAKLQNWRGPKAHSTRLASTSESMWSRPFGLLVRGRKPNFSKLADARAHQQLPSRAREEAVTGTSSK
jgi:hypothetical protein